MRRTEVARHFAALALALLLAAPPGFAPAALAQGTRSLSEPAPAGAREIAAGIFRDGDPAHRGSGRLSILRSAHGAVTVRLESLAVAPGPDLFVYLAADPDPLFPEDVLAGFRSLGRLKSRFGDQNYAVPDDVDLADWGSVVVWCEEFAVAFAVAPVGPPR